MRVSAPPPPVQTFRPPAPSSTLTPVPRFSRQNHATVRRILSVMASVVIVATCTDRVLLGLPNALDTDGAGPPIVLRSTRRGPILATHRPAWARWN